MGKPHPPEVSIVIPAYRSGIILPELMTQIDRALSEKALSYEVVIVCDSSPDDTWASIKSLARENRHLKGILLRVNAGQHNAIMAGLAHANGDVVITMDDDLQHSPFDIPKMVEKVREGYDVVYARFTSRKHALWKQYGSRLNDVVASYLIRKPRDLYLSPFRAISRTLVPDLLRYRGPYVYLDGLILSVTQNIASVEVDHHSRPIGDGNYGLRKSVSLWLKMATSFSIMPLRVTSVLGLTMSVFGFVFAFLLIIQKFTLDLMPIGWSSLIVTVLIIGGVQLLALGIIGEYLGRVLLTLNARPQFVIAESVGLEEPTVRDKDR